MTGRLQIPWKREMITPMQMTQGPCNHYLMLQQSFQLFTTEAVVLLGTTLCWKLLCSPD